MKYLIWFCIVLLVLLSSPVEITKTIKAQAMQGIVCGQGILLRANGAVIIDAWRNYALANPNSTTPPALTEYPDMITLGKSLNDKTSICLENQDGTTTCNLLSELRTKKK